QDRSDLGDRDSELVEVCSDDDFRGCYLRGHGNNNRTTDRGAFTSGETARGVCVVAQTLASVSQDDDQGYAVDLPRVNPADRSRYGAVDALFALRSGRAG